MTRLFGIITKDAFGTGYWTGEDFKLFEWMKSKEAIPVVDPIDESALLIVDAPGSYLFLHGSVLVALNSEWIHTLNSAHLKNKTLVSSASSAYDKASMALEYFTEVTEEEFGALNLNPDHILSVENY